MVNIQRGNTMNTNERYYSELDKIILRSKRKRMLRAWKEEAISAGKFLTLAISFYGMFYMMWVTLCITFPTGN